MFRHIPQLSVAALVTCAAALAGCTDRSAPTAIKTTIARDIAESEPGTRPIDFAASLNAADPSMVANAAVAAAVTGGLSSAYSQTGKLSLSVDGVGTNDASAVVQVQKPTGATVKAAFLAAASTGFSQRTLAAGDVKIDGVGFPWNLTVPSTIFSSNHWADVTALVKPKIDAAPAGRVNFTITEVATFGIDGEILAVVFDDPNQTTDNTIVLLFGAQNVAGDQFVVSLANPLDLSDPSLVLNMGLGISFGFQPGGQFSEVNVNSVRLSTSAGGQDDGTGFSFVGNGALLTVGGLDDSPTNPPPFAAASTPRTDDELYDLKPFVATGNTSITVTTRNPSNDDNIFFAAFFLTVKANIIVNPPPNQTPISNPGGPYTGSEGSAISFNGTGSSDPDGDALTYKWDFDNDGIVDATTATASHTYPDNGSYTAKLTVDDGKGATNSKTVAVTVTNVAPTGVLANTAPVNEGTSFGVSLSSITDPGAADVAVGFTYAFDCGGGAGYGAYGASATIVCPTADNATRTVRGKVRDKDGGESEYTGAAVVNNVAPVLGALSVPGAPLALQQGGTPVTISASFTDPGTLDTHTGSLSCDGGSAGGVTAAATNGSGTSSAICTFSAAGVYTVSMTVTDDDGGNDSETATSYIVIYDPSGGFVTGGGWIDSPAGSYTPDPGLTGKASFGFVAKYLKGASSPTGNTEFQFHAGALDFHSDSYEWLVISGSRAQYKGVGAIVGRAGAVKFLVTAIDGDVGGGGGVDKFRIKIWDAVTNSVIYDNQLGQLDDSSAATSLGGGSISIKAK